MAEPRDEQRFQRLAARFARRREVTEGTGFGTNPGVRVGGKVFAMLIESDLVLKLPADRVNDLIESGVAERFDPGHGRPMKEWVAISAEQSRRWPKLADEAFDFVRTTSKRRR